MCSFEMQTSHLFGFLEALIRRLQTSYLRLLHTVRQGIMAARVNANAAGPQLVRKLDYLSYTTSVRSAVSAVLKPSSAKRSKTVFFAMTELTVTAAANDCADKPGSFVTCT